MPFAAPDVDDVVDDRRASLAVAIEFPENDRRFEERGDRSAGLACAGLGSGEGLSGFSRFVVTRLRNARSFGAPDAGGAGTGDGSRICDPAPPDIGNGDSGDELAPLPRCACRTVSTSDAICARVSNHPPTIPSVDAG